MGKVLTLQDSKYVPKYVANAIYCSLWRRTGISFAMSWWISGKKGGQFFDSITIPATKKGNIRVKPDGYR